MSTWHSKSYLARFVPIGLLTSRKKTEVIIRGAIERGIEASSDDYFHAHGLTSIEVSAIFDKIDHLFGRHIPSAQGSEVTKQNIKNVLEWMMLEIDLVKSAPTRLRSFA